MMSKRELCTPLTTGPSGNVSLDTTFPLVSVLEAPPTPPLAALLWALSYSLPHSPPRKTPAIPME